MLDGWIAFIVGFGSACYCCFAATNDRLTVVEKKKKW